ncbi:YciE/YciF ferroxidase family protein [Terrimonas alba]|uniref:YciE/YciF ferroxidase family protein n=1 Tax=Terrimonas alba TaxID=3349636 RepID=UPI0035F4D78A
MPNTKTQARPVVAKKRTNSESAIQPGSQLEKYFTDSLKDIYWAEKHLSKELPKMNKAATTQQLKDAIGVHTTQTEEHVTRLEQIFELMGKKPQAKKCDAMEGLIKEGHSVLEETEEGSMTRDAAIIIAAQKVEHYEIATYGGLVTLANAMGQPEVADILKTTLEEEEATDAGLSSLAENDINWEAELETENNES